MVLKDQGNCSVTTAQSLKAALRSVIFRDTEITEDYRHWTAQRQKGRSYSCSRDRLVTQTPPTEDSYEKVGKIFKTWA